MMMMITFNLLSVFILSFWFAKVEIQIEGPAGWAKNLPTWRIEKHWLLDLFWGGRAMTGYHAWVFSFIILFFHFPFVFFETWSLALELRVLADIMFFWVWEDFLWFALNPAFGWKKFLPANVPWHPRWILGLPLDYWIFHLVAIALLVSSAQ